MGQVSKSQDFRPASGTGNSDNSNEANKKNYFRRDLWYCLAGYGKRCLQAKSGPQVLEGGSIVNVLAARVNLVPFPAQFVGCTARKYTRPNSSKFENSQGL